MSKGGAGKVYFVLYLAVILELLIIIVERDEAEEHLIAKQKESMRIVESILSQLQVGAGSEGINTRPQDQITIPPPGINVKEIFGGVDIKAERRYLIEVGVTDVTASLRQLESEEPADYLERLKRFVRLANVSDLRYEILFSSGGSDEMVPQDSSAWSKRGETELKLNIDEMEQQINNVYEQHKADPKALVDNLRMFMLDAKYNAPSATGFKPGSTQEAEFMYNKAETEVLKDKAAKKRVFSVNFEPKDEGWYKLRFTSKANKILGVYNKDGAMDIDPEQKVNIGTVTLKVKDLLKVRDELQKNLTGLPTAQMAVQDPNGFEDALRKLKEEATEVDVRSKVELYGYIVKLVTPGLSGTFDQNKSAIEYNIRVLKPQPQITDPKIADLRPVVRVFSKLSKLTLPMSVTPANGQTSFKQNPGNASVAAGGAVTSSSGGAGTKWVGKDLVIPVAGNLQPREEPYVFELVQTNGGKTSEPVQCSVYVYDASITNAEEVNSLLEASWGDAMELVVQPSSGSTIPPDQFMMQFGFGGGNQIAPLRKLNVGPNDRVIVPPGSDKVSLTVAWKDPISGDVVELFSGSGDVGLKRPMIVTTDLRAEPISDQNSAEFKVIGIVIRPPQVSEDERADVGDVTASVTNSTVRDMRTGQTYKVTVVGKPRKTTGQNYEVTVKLTGGKTPLTKGQV
ncbi:MAG: hypothetical protein MUC47_04010, partial [Candidatus Kapabacteria bacterium]|nr:hypothetical protein [Candidatus Kapabacteria bacterium]